MSEEVNELDGSSMPKQNVEVELFQLQQEDMASWCNQNSP